MKRVLVLLACLLWPAAHAEIPVSDRIEISGFARLVGGKINDEKVVFEAYDDSVSFSEQSLFALQADVDLTDKLSLTGQGLLHSSDRRDSGLEWLYLTYEPTTAWQVKLGKLRTPFVSYSDVIDVGFAYPWVSAPFPIYGSYLFTNYEGASVTYRAAFDEFTWEGEIYWGNDEFDVLSRGIEVPVEISNLHGFRMEARRGNLKARFAYHRANSVEVQLDSLEDFVAALRGIGFSDVADSLALEGETDALHLGLRYDNLDYFAEVEFLRVDSEIIIGPARIDGYYFSVGKNFNPLQVHLTAGQSNSVAQEAVDGIPLGVSPVQDGLAAGYDFILSTVPSDDLDYIATGVRWDFLPNMALKGEISWIQGTEPSQYFSINDADVDDYDGKTILFQVALEWIF